MVLTRHSLFFPVKIIAIILIATFFVQDLSWAYSYHSAYDSSANNKLAPAPFGERVSIENKAIDALIFTIERTHSIPREVLSLEGVEAVLNKNPEFLQKNEADVSRGAGEIRIIINHEIILRYIDHDIDHKNGISDFTIISQEKLGVLIRQILTKNKKVRVPAGSVAGVFRYLYLQNITTPETALSVDEISGGLDRAYDAINRDLRALYHHLHLLKKADPGKSGKNARYYVPEHVKKKYDDIAPILLRLVHEKLRPARRELEETYKTIVNLIGVRDPSTGEFSLAPKSKRTREKGGFDVNISGYGTVPFSIGTNYEFSDIELVPLTDNWGEGFEVYCQDDLLGTCYPSTGKFSPLQVSRRTEGKGRFSIAIPGYKYKRKRLNIGMVCASLDIKLTPLDGGWEEGFIVSYRDNILAFYDAGTDTIELNYMIGKPDKEGSFILDGARYSLGEDYARGSASKMVMIIAFDNIDLASGFKVYHSGSQIASYDKERNIMIGISVTGDLRSSGVINAKDLRDALEAKAAAAFTKFAVRCREEMHLIRQYMETSDMENIALSVKRVMAYMDEDFNDAELEKLASLVADSMSNLSAIHFTIGAKAFNNDTALRMLAYTENVLTELERLMAAKRLLDAPKARITSGYLDASRILDSESNSEAKAAAAVTKFAARCREEMRLIRQYIEKNDVKNVIICAEKAIAYICEDFKDQELRELMILIMDSMINFSTLRLFGDKMIAEKDKALRLLDETEDVFEELEKLMAAGMLMEAPKAIITSGYLDASRVLNGKVKGEIVAPGQTRILLLLSIPNKNTFKNETVSIDKITDFMIKYRMVIGARESDINTVLDEMVLNVVEHGHGGEIMVTIEKTASKNLRLKIIAEDNGSGGLSALPDELVRASLAARKRLEYEDTGGIRFARIALVPDNVTIKYSGKRFVRFANNKDAGAWFREEEIAEGRIKGTRFELEFDLGRELVSWGPETERLADIHYLFNIRNLGRANDDTKILLSENLFIKDSDDTELTQIWIALAPLLNSGYIAIMKPDEIKRAATNRNVSKERLAVIFTEEDFNNEDIWEGCNKERSLRSSVLILGDRLIGNNYLYIEGIIGLAQAMMENNKHAVKKYYDLISGTVINDEILDLLNKDGQNNLPFAIKAILRFKPITRTETKDLDELKIRMENFLIAA